MRRHSLSQARHSPTHLYVHPACPGRPSASLWLRPVKLLRPARPAVTSKTAAVWLISCASGTRTLSASVRCADVGAKGCLRVAPVVRRFWLTAPPGATAGSLGAVASSVALSLCVVAAVSGLPPANQPLVPHSPSVDTSLFWASPSKLPA